MTEWYDVGNKQEAWSQVELEVSHVTGCYRVQRVATQSVSQRPVGPRFYFTTFARRFFVQVIVCAAFEVVTMAGFRRGIGTRAKTKLDVETLQMQLD